MPNLRRSSQNRRGAMTMVRRERADRVLFAAEYRSCSVSSVKGLPISAYRFTSSTNQQTADRMWWAIHAYTTRSLPSRTKIVCLQGRTGVGLMGIAMVKPPRRVQHSMSRERCSREGETHTNHPYVLYALSISTVGASYPRSHAILSFIPVLRSPGKIVDVAIRKSLR